jgi:hypothetical protein
MRMLLACTVALICTGAWGAPADNYTLYYSDSGHNVCRVTLGADGKVIGKSAKLTSRGGCDRFSISPDERRIVGFGIAAQTIDKDTDTKLTTWKIFTEEPAKKGSRKVLGVIGPFSGVPTVLWSPKNTYFLLGCGVTNRTIDVYEFATGKKIVERSTMPASISPDERFIVTEVKYPLKPSAAAVIDLRTGKSVEIAERTCPAVWAGSSKQIAWIDSGSLFAAELSFGPTELSLFWREKVSSAGYDLRWVPGKGVYFVMGSTQSRELGCYSANLKTIDHGQMLPELPDSWQAAAFVKTRTRVQAEDAAFSPDSALVAYTVSSRLWVVDSSGKAVQLTAGRCPVWKGPASLWSPWLPGW